MKMSDNKKIDNLNCGSDECVGLLCECAVGVYVTYI